MGRAVQRNTLIAISIAAMVAAGGGYFFLYGPVSTLERERYGPQCSRWISREFNDNRPTRIVDSWKKPGRLVFVVLASAREGEAITTGEIFPCVIDRRAGVMTKPSAFDTSWQRSRW